MFDAMPRTGAAATRRSSKQNPMQILVNLVEEDPTASTGLLFRKWWKEVQKDDELLEAVGRHVFANFYSCIERDKRRERPKKSPREVMEAQRDQVAKLVKTVKHIVFMELLLPSGKHLRESTFAECSAAGGWFKLVATKGNPSEVVGDVLTEDDLRAIGRKC